MVDGDWQVTASANQRGAGAEIVETSAKAKDVTALQFASEIAYNKDGINANGRNECQWMGSIKESKPYMQKKDIICLSIFHKLKNYSSRNHLLLFRTYNYYSKFRSHITLANIRFE